MSDQTPIVVTAAVIERDGKVLIGQRLKGQQHSLKWEFPGGKVESGESPRDALIRELWEELAIRAEIDEEITHYEYTYPGRRPIHLYFFSVTKFQGEPRNQAFEQILWDYPSRFPEYDFLEGDVDFVRRMAAEADS
jgi:8-oxo-dGTP diphosphatase